MEFVIVGIIILVAGACAVAVFFKNDEACKGNK
jgi:hypothetical protein